MAFWAPGLRLMRSTVAAKFGWSSGIASANTAIAKPWPLPANRSEHSGFMGRRDRTHA